MSNQISEILTKALAGYDDKYKMESNGQKYIQWAAVERDLIAVLTAETQRREAAEAVVDAHWHENEAQLLADAYREKYPAESTMTACNIHEHDGAFKCLSHRRKWGAVLRPDDPCKGWVKP